MAVSFTLTASCCSTTSLPHSSKPSGLTLFRTSIVEVWKVHVRVHELADERHQCSANEHLQQGVHSIRSPRIGKAGNVIPQLPGMPAATDNAQTVLRIASTFTDRLLIHISSRSIGLCTLQCTHQRRESLPQPHDGVYFGAHQILLPRDAQADRRAPGEPANKRPNCTHQRRNCHPCTVDCTYCICWARRIDLQRGKHTRII